MSRVPQILVADDDRTVRTVISHALNKQGYQVGATTSVAGLWDMATTGRGDVLITDVNFPDGDALDLLPRLQAKRPDPSDTDTSNSAISLIVPLAAHSSEAESTLQGMKCA